MTNRKFTKAFFMSFMLLLVLLGARVSGSNLNIPVGNKGSKNVFIAGPVLFEQTGGIQWDYQNSQKYADLENKAKTCEMVDDFDVPAGQTWNVKTIIAYGSTTAVFDTLNVFIYNDDNGAPGTLFQAFPNMLRANDDFTYFTDIINLGNTGVFQIELPSALALTQGKYWLAVQIVSQKLDYSYTWNWYNCTTNNDKNFYWRNPLDGYSLGYTDWTDGATVNPYSGGYGAAFILCAPRLQNDISVVSIDAPVNGDLGTAEIITATILNYGTLNQSGFNIKYKIDDGSWVVENVGSLVVEAGGQVQYTFTTPGNFSEGRAYSLTVSTALASDGNTSNDQISTTVYNYGTIYTFTQFDSISTCTGTFTDPGGVNGDWNAPFGDTVTIYPGGPNLRTRLTFLEFNNGWGEFWIYDGKDANAPPIDLTPDNPNTLYAYDVEIATEVTAKNTDGALTIVFNANNGNQNGWIATISCFQPPADDFQMVKLFTDIPTIFNDDVVHVKAVVYNAGLNTQSKVVSFTVNGQVLGQASTIALGPNEYDTVSVEWIPATAGHYNFTASIPADGGANPADNIISSSVDVYEKGKLVESFEGEVFPPEFWRCALGAWQRTEGDTFLGQEGNWYASFMSADHDTLVTPRLIINANDTMRFRAASQMWWFCNLELYWSDTPHGPWNLISQVPFTGFETTLVEFAVDISAAAGNHYIAFITNGGEYGWAKSMRLDFVRGPKIFYYNHDMATRGLICDQTPVQSDTVSYKINVKNIGVENITNGSYTVKLMMVTDAADVELASIPGTALASMASKEYNFSYCFNTTGKNTIYGIVDYASDENNADNRTRNQEIWVQPFGTEMITAGDASEYLYGIPMAGNNNGEVQQTMYYPEEIGAPGTISGISYYFRKTSAANYLKIPIQIWIGETENADLSGGFLPSSQLSLVFNDSVNFYGQSQGEWFIPFNLPFIYTGKNLVVMLYRGDSPEYAFLEFLAGPGTMSFRTLGVSYLSGPVDLNDVDALNTHYSFVASEYFANTTFYRITTGMGEIAGHVFDNSSNPIPGAKISLLGTTAQVLSDVNGYYKLPVVPHGNQSVEAVMFGFNDNRIETEVVEDVQTTLDFIMQPKPQVIVYGKIVRSDNDAGLANVTVTLTGYDDYIITTTANGNFSIPNVYADEVYNFTAEYPRFLTYIDDSVVVTPGQNTNLGTIVLQEIFEPSFYVNTSEVNADANITWNIPYTGTNSLVNLWDEEGFSSGYTADANENVWMGNYFDVSQNGSITGFNIQLWNYPGYDYSSGDVTMDIFNAGQELVASQVFNIPDMNQEIFTIHIDVPDVTFNQSFYAMIHYNVLGFYTPLIAFEQGYNSPAPDLARVKYPNESIKTFSGLTGMAGIFEITADVILADGKMLTLDNNTKSLTGFNIYRGLISDMANADSWTPLNDSPISFVTSPGKQVSPTAYTDDTWPPAESGFYTYAVEAIYTEGPAVKSFSNAISSGMYGSLTVNVTTNGGDPGTGAEVKLVNNNGDNTYEYTQVVGENNSAVLGKIMKGNYTISVKLPYYNSYSDEALVIDPAAQELNIELIQIIAAPSQLRAIVNNEAKQVRLSWNLGDSTSYILDDGTYESALSIAEEGNAWIGNKFEVTDVGYINSVDIYGYQDTTGTGDGEVTVEIFDAEGNLIDISAPTLIPSNGWINVPLPNVPFAGTFFAMVHYNLVGNTNMIGADITGPNPSSGYYYDEEYGWVALETWNMPCALMVRVNAQVQGSTYRVYSANNSKNIYELPDFVHLVKATGVATFNPVSGKSPEVTFNVYLENMDTPIATGISAMEYVITSEYLPINGTYTVGVTSVYSSGMSDMITTQFDYNGIGVNNILDKPAFIYPNPARNVLYITQAACSTIEMYNVAGRIISTFEVNQISQKMDVSSIPAGSYYFKIMNGSKTQVQRVEIVK